MLPYSTKLALTREFLYNLFKLSKAELLLLRSLRLPVLQKNHAADSRAPSNTLSGIMVNQSPKQTRLKIIQVNTFKSHKMLFLGRRVVWAE